MVTTAPFATKEPEHYQAVRVITTSNSLNQAAPNTTTSSILLARAGENRRAEYHLANGTSYVLLELSGNRYVLLPQEKIYAEQALTGENSAEMVPDVSAEGLLNRSSGQLVYESLGSETIDSRATQKYRVVRTGNTSDANDYTLLWIDDSLKIPIRSETSFNDGQRSWKRVVELTSIKVNVEADLLRLPSDFRKVTAGELWSRLSYFGRK